MKKVLLILIALIGLGTYGNSLAITCNQTFDGGHLRYGGFYNFTDDFKNTSNKNEYLNTYSVSILNETFLKKGGSFDWTSAIRNANFRITPGQNMTVLSTTSSRQIAGVPANRTNGTRYSYDFGIYYTISYDTSNNYPDASDDIYHTECIYYSVSWCGDGVLDKGFETCDPNDPTRTGWGNGGCDNQCKPIVNQVPACTNLTATPTSGVNSLTTNVSCSGTNATSYRIDCGNGQTLNTATGTCSYGAVGNYNIRCYVNDTITSAACQKPVTVTTEGGGPSCNNLTATPASGVNSLTTNVSCNGTSATSYRIDCGNGQILNTATGTCSYNAIGNYNIRCYVNDTITSAACQKPVSVTTEGGAPSCNSLTATPTSGVNSLTTNVSCSGSNVSSYRIDCGNGQILNTATGTCSYGAVGNYTIRCYVNDTTTSTACEKPVSVTTENPSSSNGGNTSNGGGGSTSSSSGGGSGGGSSSSSGGGSPTYCGDGILQRPNDNLEMEECDFGTGTWPAWCRKSDCKITNLTYPNDGMMELGPNGQVVIGDGMNVYSAYSLQTPYIRNLSASDLYLGEICTVRSGSPVVLKINGVENHENCTLINGNGVLKKGATYLLPTPEIVGTTASLPSGVTQADNLFVTTLKRDGIVYYDSNSTTPRDAWFNGKLRVRVSKPAVTTIGGGTSFVGGGDNISNVGDVSLTGKEGDVNFVGPSIGTGGLSTITTQVTDTGSVSEIAKDGDKIAESVVGNTPSAPTGYNANTSVNLNDFKNYNGITNAYVIRNTKFTVNASTFAGLSGARTYIVENGDLVVNGNITYTDNIAFVVRGGDIQIDKEVREIKGTFIAIPKSGIGGKIVGIGGKTIEPLKVFGSLYGNVEGLVSQRTFVRENSSGLLDVGTIVSFGSSVFRDPAPLTTTFINEYLEATKVAQ